MQTLRTLDALEREGLLTPDPRLAAAAQSMAIAITPEMLALIDRGDPAHDPIARQFVPSAAETEVSPDELLDPIGDEARSPVKGIVHRYPDRVLLKPLHVCPVYCRFCFRREKVGPGGEALSAAELSAALAYIRARPEIWEVILTGGDPLMLAPRRLAELLANLDAIGHLGVIRIHSRVPIVDPERVTDELVAALKPRRATLWFGVHCNHARELSARDARGAGAAGRCRHSPDGPDGAAGRRQRRRRNPRPAHARPGDGARETVLPAPSRPGARHRPFPGVGRTRPGVDEGAARPAVGPRPADLRARRAGRPRQGADRSRPISATIPMRC